MTAQSAINLAEISKVNLFITSAGKIRYEGDQHSVDQLLPLIKKHKAEIIQLLSAHTCKRPIPVEPALKPCSLCKGVNFIHGNQGGYYCKKCQPGHKGIFLKAGGRRIETDLKGNELDWRASDSNKSVPVRKAMVNLPPSLLIAHRWILQHRFELLGAGWTSPELYRRNKGKGIVWLTILNKPGLDLVTGKKGEIVFLFKNTTGKNIQQTAFPRRMNA